MDFSRGFLSLISVCLLSLSSVSDAARAHDFGSGPRMGLPPRVSDAREQLILLIPAGVDESTEKGLKGVIDRAKMWPQHLELTVCFLSGSRKARARVAAVGVEWTNYVNLRLNFGDMSNPRDCDGSGSEHIKIDFLTHGPDSGHWSYVGVDTWQFAHSMNLHGFGLDRLSVREADYRGVVLHEFGHALGFEHEHQSPAAKCDAEFIPEKVAAWAKRMGWSNADVKTNLARLQPKTSREFTRHDRDSLLHYSLPAEFFRDGKKNRCWVPKNNELSKTDKEFAMSMYPPRIASIDVSPSGSTRMGSPAAAPQDPKAAEVDYRSELQRSFEGALAKGGVTGDRARELARKFGTEIAKLRSSRRPTK